MDFNEAYDDTSTSVGLAARMGNTALLQELLQNGRPTNGHDNRGWRPLHEAADGGHVECVRLLLTADDAEVDALTHECTTPLQLSCWSGSPFGEVVKLLLSAGADPNMKEGDEWVLPLPKAVANNNLEIVKHLLAAGADPNRMDYNYGAPLHVSAEQGLLDISQLLIEKGADINWQDEAGRTALHVLMFPPFVKTTLVPLMNVLIDKGCDINARMTDGTTPLMLAVQSNLEDAVMRLLECKADPNLMKIDGVMALHFAIEFCPDFQKSVEQRENPEDQEGHSRILKKIIDLTATHLVIPQSLQPIKYSIFHLAVEWNRFNTLKMLIETGLPPDAFLQEAANAALDEADVNLFDQIPLVMNLGTEVDTPLGFLLSKPLTAERVEMAKFMIDKGSNVNAVAHNGLPPLVAAVKHQRLTYGQNCAGRDIVNYLLKNGANVLHKIRKTDVLPAALHISSLFNVSAFFTLLQWGIPVHKVYTRETLDQLSQKYSSSMYYTIYPLFPWRVISCLNVLNMFVPQLPLHTKVMFDLGRIVDDENLTAAWDNLDALIVSPKELQLLSVLAVRRAVGESKGWNDLSSSLQKVQFGSAPLPQMIMDRLLFKQIRRTSLYQCPPRGVMPMYSVPVSPSYHSGDGSPRYSISDNENDAASPLHEMNESGEESNDDQRTEGSGADKSDDDNDRMDGTRDGQKSSDNSPEKMSGGGTEEEDSETERTSPSSSSSPGKGRTKRKRSNPDS